MNPILEAVIAVLMVSGGAFTLAGAIGLARLLLPAARTNQSHHGGGRQHHAEFHDLLHGNNRRTGSQ